MSYHVGLDLGGTKIEAVALKTGFKNSADPRDFLIRRCRVSTERTKGYIHILKQCIKLVHQVLTEVGGKLIPLSVGIGTPGHVSPKDGGIKNSNTTCLMGKDLIGDLSKALGCSVSGENDANLFTLAEAKWGAGRDHATVFGVILGTGVGGGIAIDGRVRSGSQGIAGEWGHNTLVPGGRPCYCGRKGCVETYLSGVGFKKTLLEMGFHQSTKAFVEEVGDDLLGLGPKGHRAAMAYLTHFGQALATVVNILDPHVVVLGGGLSQWRALYTHGCSALKAQVFNDELLTKVEGPKLGDSAGVFGAALIGAQALPST